MAATKKGTKSKAKKGSASRGSASTRSSSTRADKNIEAFRNALEKSLVVSRDRLQDAVDDAVERGRMTRTDANELVSKLVSRSRKQTDDLLKDLEKLLDQARAEVESRVGPARKRAERAAKRVRHAAEPALAEADRLRRRAGVGTAPITGYEQLNANQVKARLKGMTAADLRKVRTQEKRGKARKSVLSEIEKQLAK